MKTLLTILTLLISTVSLYGSDSELPAVMANYETSAYEAERIIDKYSKKIITSFNEFVSVAAPVAKTGFEIVVRKNVIQGLLSLLSIIFPIFFGYLYYKQYNIILKLLTRDNVPEWLNASEGPWGETNVSVNMVITFLFTIATSIISFVLITKNIMKLMIPEWYAVMDIMKLFNL